MNSRIRLLPALTLVALSATDAAPAQPGDDRASLAMLEMKLIGSVVESLREAVGEYPSAGQPLQPVREVLKPIPQVGPLHLSMNDPWGSPYLYRARNGMSPSYQVISFGADRRADGAYEGPPVGIGALAEVVDFTDGADDLVLFDGRLTKRPFRNLGPALRTVNAMVRIATAASSYAVDNNEYPGGSFTPLPVADLIDELVPVYMQELPLVDGWGRPILVTSDGQRFYLWSWGADGKQDRQYYPDMPCGVARVDAGPVAAASADVVMACGELLVWPAGIGP